jgi:hypothetical protein
MAAFSVVRFRVKPGREQDFLDAHKKDDGELARSATRQHDQYG